MAPTCSTCGCVAALPEWLKGWFCEREDWRCPDHWPAKYKRLQVGRPKEGKCS